MTGLAASPIPDISVDADDGLPSGRSIALLAAGRLPELVTAAGPFAPSDKISLDKHARRVARVADLRAAISHVLCSRAHPRRLH